MGSLKLIVFVFAMHHSFSAEFDSTKQVTLRGSITKVEWRNPHTYFYMDVKDETGKIGSWAIEGGAPNLPAAPNRGRQAGSVRNMAEHARGIQHRIRAEIDDPNAYSTPWTISGEFVVKADTELLEFICEENEKD